jgi:hypothetical protein
MHLCVSLTLTGKEVQWGWDLSRLLPLGPDPSMSFLPLAPRQNREAAHHSIEEIQH